MTESALRASARRPWLAGFAACNAFGAWAGAVGLVTGGMDFGESINDRLPFDSLVLAGLALGIIVGIPLTVLAWSAWRGGPRTDDVALAVGLTLIVWIVVQVAVIRAFSLFQPAYLAVGAYFVTASHRVSLSPRRRGVLFVAVGSVLVSARWRAAQSCCSCSVRRCRSSRPLWPPRACHRRRSPRHRRRWGWSTSP